MAQGAKPPVLGAELFPKRLQRYLTGTLLVVTTVVRTKLEDCKKLSIISV